MHALGFADGASRIIFRADGRIAPSVRTVAAAEEARFILLSRDAREVTATHKLSVSPITERDLFFPRSRGFSPDAARAIMTSGLVASELACIKNDMMRAILESRV
jgi:Fe-S cluster assembly scaffold protein SufB